MSSGGGSAKGMALAMIACTGFSKHRGACDSTSL